MSTLATWDQSPRGDETTLLSEARKSRATVPKTNNNRSEFHEPADRECDFVGANDHAQTAGARCPARARARQFRRSQNAQRRAAMAAARSPARDRSLSPSDARRSPRDRRA